MQYKTNTQENQQTQSWFFEYTNEIEKLLKGCFFLWICCVLISELARERI